MNTIEQINATDQVEQGKIIPFSLKDAPSLIEKAWPAAKISAESQKERKAGSGQTLTGLGSYWKGRKPLILTRACVLASLMPATDDLERDIAIFERLMGIANESFGRRFTDGPGVFAKLFPGHVKSVASDTTFQWMKSDKDNRLEQVKKLPALVLHNETKRIRKDLETLVKGEVLKGKPAEFMEMLPEDWKPFIETGQCRWVWRTDITVRNRQGKISNAFAKRPYVERLKDTKRPEEIPENHLLAEIWKDVNAHLGTDAQSITELVEQLGIMRFGHRPKVADTFSGSGSIPYEAARIGCEVHASDLNPVACMLTWGAFNIVGANPKDHKRMQKRQTLVMKKINRDITKMKVEHDVHDNRAKVFLYCLETKCPRTGWMVPLAPSWVISKPRKIIARLVPDPQNKRYDIEIKVKASDEEMAKAAEGTVRKGRMFHPMLTDEKDALGVAIREIRGDYKDEDGNNQNRLRLWKKHDFMSRPDDIWQERLYAIQWLDGEDIKEGKVNPRTRFAAPTQDDLDREERVKNIVAENLTDWQEQGLVPDMKIEPGAKTTEPIRTRGWTHWHHLFNPRHLLLNAIAAKHAKKNAQTCFGLASLVDRNGCTSRWDSGCAKGQQTFTNQALNTMLNYPARGFLYTNSIFEFPPSVDQIEIAKITSSTAMDHIFTSDILITDPPYADAVQYDEITEFFIAWLRKNPPKKFRKWKWDSRRELAIKVKNKNKHFKTAMIEAYKAMTEQMSDNGLQIVQFTHQDAGTWSDMAQIFWGAGLQVVQDWYVSTETTSGLKKGGHVQGTHMIVLRKRQGEKPGYKDEIAFEIRTEVEHQIREMTGLNMKITAARGKKDTRSEAIFSDADLQISAYAAALRVLTGYTEIDSQDMIEQSLRPRTNGEKSLIDDLTGFAVQAANNFLVPDGLDRNLWIDLNGAERFYLRMMDIEAAGPAKLDQFQNFAKAFKVNDYTTMMASKTPNDARLKSATQLGGSLMAEDTDFGGKSVVRLALRGIYRIAKEDETDKVLDELRDKVPDYFRNRGRLCQVITYIGQKQKDAHEASAARVLGDAIRTEMI